MAVAIPFGDWLRGRAPGYEAFVRESRARGSDNHVLFLVPDHPLAGFLLQLVFCLPIAALFTAGSSAIRSITYRSGVTSRLFVLVFLVGCLLTAACGLCAACINLWWSFFPIGLAYLASAVALAAGGVFGAAIAIAEVRVRANEKRERELR
jgi:hypothetical protein